MKNKEMFQVIVDHLQTLPYEWIRWAAFDMPKNGDNVKLTFYQNKPERRSDFWYSSEGRMVSINVRLRGFDWTESLCEIRHVRTEYESECEKLKNEIIRLETRLNLKKEMLFNLMRRQHETR